MPSSLLLAFHVERCSSTPEKCRFAALNGSIKQATSIPFQACQSINLASIDIAESQFVYRPTV